MYYDYRFDKVYGDDGYEVDQDSFSVEDKQSLMMNDRNHMSKEFFSIKTEGEL